MDFSGTIEACDLKVGRYRQLIEIMKVCEYWRSRSFLYHIFFQVLYVLCLIRPRYQVSVYRTIGPLVYVCKCCNVSCAIFVRRREASACLIMLSTKQGSHWYHFLRLWYGAAGIRTHDLPIPKRMLCHWATGASVTSKYTENLLLTDVCHQRMFGNFASDRCCMRSYI